MLRHALSLLLLFFAFSANAQDVHFSPLVSFDFGSPLFINRAPGGFNPLNVTDSGISSSFTFGLGAEAAILKTGTIGLVGRITGVYSTGQFNSSQIGGDTISGYDWGLLTEAMLAWQPSAFSLRAGPWASARIAGAVLANHPGSFFGSNQSPSFHYGLTAGVALFENFPIEPELNTHLDLTELSEAGANAWSIGLSLAYHFGVAGQAIALPKVEEVKATLAPTTPQSVHFLINGAWANGNPPLERVETHVKQYAMVDSANVSPRVTQWIEDSYHLPSLGLSCKFSRGSGAELLLLIDRLPLLQKTFPGTAESESEPDTVFDLDRDSAWQTILSHLNTGENNRIIAELRTTAGTVQDTLVLPPADTTRATTTIVKQEFRFELSDHFGRYAGGAQSLDLLLDRMKELLGSVSIIRIRESANEQNLPSHAALEKKLAQVLGNREIERAVSADVYEDFVVVME